MALLLPMHLAERAVARRFTCQFKPLCAYFLPGSLLPFALNASPKGFRAPPPAGFWWHAPHAFPVWAANSGFACADRGVAIAKVPQMITPVAATVKILKFIVSSVDENEEQSLFLFREDCLISINHRGQIGQWRDGGQRHVFG